MLFFKSKFGNYEGYRFVKNSYLEEKQIKNIYKIYENCAFNNKCPKGYSSLKIDFFNIPSVYHTDRVLFYTDNIISDCPNIPNFIEKCGKSTIVHEKFFQVLKDITNTNFDTCNWKPPIIFRYVKEDELIKNCGENASGCSAGKIIYSIDNQWETAEDKCYSFHHELVHSFLNCLNFDWSKFNYDLNHVFTFPIQTYVYQYVPECHQVYDSQIEAYRVGFSMLEANRPNPPISGWSFGEKRKDTNCQTMSFYIIYDEILNKQNSYFIKQITTEMKNKRPSTDVELAKIIYSSSGNNNQVLESYREANCGFTI